MTAKNAIVLASAIQTFRCVLVSVSAEDGRAADLGQPLLLDALELARLLEARERLVHAADERVALLEDHAEVLAAGLRRELAEDLPLGNLDGGDVERRRQVDDEAV